MKEADKYKGLRQKLVDDLRNKGISDENVLNAINNVPRHAFMDSGFIGFSYKDKAFPIGAGQTISQPYTVAMQTQLLEIKRGDKILEVGTGSGYQAAVLLELGAKVFSMERQRELFLKAQVLLPKLGYNPHLFFSDGIEGLPTYGPFDKILITAAAGEIPVKLLMQLKVGGIMVVPHGSSVSQTMTKIVKTGENTFDKTDHGDYIFVPMIKGTEN
jgi:protein-L-isoaspartate(D-aspartate) O-methyltransferase